MFWAIARKAGILLEQKLNVWLFQRFTHSLLRHIHMAAHVLCNTREIHTLIPRWAWDTTSRSTEQIMPQLKAKVFIYIFMGWVVCSLNPSPDRSFAIIYGFHVLSGTGRVFQAVAREHTTDHENRWQAQSSVYLFYRGKINTAKQRASEWSLPLLTHDPCSRCATASEVVSVWTEINECVECRLTSLDALQLQSHG